MKRLFFMFLLLSLVKTMYLYKGLFGQILAFHLILNETGYLVFFIAISALIRPKNIFLPLFFYNVLLSVVYFSLLTYSYYFNQIPTFSALGNSGQLGKVFSSVVSLIKMKDLLLFIDFPFLLILAFYINPISIMRKKSLIYLGSGLTWIILSFLILYKPSLTHSKIAMGKVGIFNYELAAIEPQNEGPIQMVKYRDSKRLNKEIRHIKGINLPANPRYFGISKGKNLIVIQVEAMQDFVLNKSVDGQKITPFLDSWINQNQAIHFDRVFEQIGPGNTSDAEFIMNTSLYPDADSATTNAYEKTPFPSLPKLLTEKGYQTATMHVDDIHFWNRIHLYPNLGWSKYYDKAYFGTDDKIGLGASDRVLFQKSIEAMNHMKQPFYTQLITLSSHHPFQIPRKYQSLVLPRSLKGTLTANYLESMHYVDSQIKYFVDDLKEKGLYDSSVIMIYGDHFGLGADTTSQEEKNFLGQLINHPYLFIDQFNIPLIIHANGTKGGVNHQLGGQVDFLPTVANLLGIKLDNFVHFGDDLFNINSNLFGMRAYMPTGSFFTDNKIFIPGVGYEDAKVVDLNTGKNIPKTKRDKNLFRRILEIESLSDTYLKNLPVE